LLPPPIRNHINPPTHRLHPYPLLPLLFPHPDSQDFLLKEPTIWFYLITTTSNTIVMQHRLQAGTIEGWLWMMKTMNCYLGKIQIIKRVDHGVQNTFINITTIKTI